MRKIELIFLFLVCMSIALFLPNSLWAAVTGPCGTCHTMHNSQGGEGLGGSPSTHLTKGGCIGCHTGTNDGSNVTPFVYSETEPTYGTDTLAGGHFWWVATAGGGNDTKGHNVLGLSNQDINISAGEGAPGGWITCANSCHMTLAATQTSVPELGSGCEGCHLAVKHHKNDHPEGNYNNVVSEDGGWFRYCSGHMSGVGHGVEGIEDQDWQYSNSASDHNEYLGNVVDHTANGGFYNIGDTMTAYCCGCHGGFHQENSATGSLWIRHPSDAVIPAGGEYAAYTEYDPLAPVARPTLTDSAPSPTVTPGTDLVMCLSCHRAHGSPYADMLRWDYADGTFAGGGGAADGTGCFVCHTEKDD